MCWFTLWYWQGLCYTRPLVNQANSCRGTFVQSGNLCQCASFCFFSKCNYHCLACHRQLTARAWSDRLTKTRALWCKNKELRWKKKCYTSSKGARLPGLSNGESLLRVGLISCFLPLLFAKELLHPVRLLHRKSTAFEKKVYEDDGFPPTRANIERV